VARRCQLPHKWGNSSALTLDLKIRCKYLNTATLDISLLDRWAEWERLDAGALATVALVQRIPAGALVEGAEGALEAVGLALVAWALEVGVGVALDA
jgi:hypothetical protein